MYYQKALPRSDLYRIFQNYSVNNLLLFMLCFIGCTPPSHVLIDNEPITHAKMLPINVDTNITENIGREALEKLGYNEIIRLADRARFVEYKYSASIELIGYGSEISSGFTPVFSRYAVAAAVTTQADSPLPGPADIAAIGVLVLGLVDAGLLDGYLLNTIADWMIDSGTLLMSENVIDTGVMEKVAQIITASGSNFTKEEICKVLTQLYRQAEGREKLKIQRTQKGWKCRNEQKRQ